MIEFLSDEAALAAIAAAATVDALQAGLAARGHASLIGTGGRSPAPVYDALRDANLDWGRVTVSLSDDRFLPVTSPDSNERLVRERLLQGRASAATFLPLYANVPTPEAAAEIAEPLVRALAPFDMLFLGMGEDGHIASLIPGSPVMEAGLDPAGDGFVIGIPAGVGSPPVARISLTLPALLQARATLVLIRGEVKREIVENGSGLPVHALIKQAKAPLRVLWAP
ncbi:MAG: 6-phosphogluconolactonase [Phenylobacterium sp.]|uniref:6-phosphogluconolactonase n=1 Tax=Phenylobacterium sp. TaxID=1871053 RepID=UPI001B67D889|nr:6-phosphogluconolactonase [Phenylobacterium sp.]MBP7649408.1 6-phosphogluconolactonase [Phenylobacterium sp.]MBP7816310.1 6-phosphogluconolactonase [Phenylobacterium sp.]MBP9230997.1 6-phosphogluconolactonase [Phenylobacterium sp.]MBP9754454.1 6-phosphogluconolactonase [Phenylobacterium sp.]